MQACFSVLPGAHRGHNLNFRVLLRVSCEFIALIAINNCLSYGWQKQV